MGITVVQGTIEIVAILSAAVGLLAYIFIRLDPFQARGWHAMGTTCLCCSVGKCVWVLLEPASNPTVVAIPILSMLGMGLSLRFIAKRMETRPSR